jgi:mono/diheme cytochrome c family protein
LRAILVAVLLLSACDRGPFHQPLVLGGRSYSPSLLNRGFHLYQKGCRACHGDNGDGHGASAPGLWPPPRDLTQGVYKFGRVPAPGLPPDTELARILRTGLGGTAMLAWQIDDADMDALLGYVKALAPRWRTDPIGEPVLPSGDPFAGLDRGKLTEVVERGEALYHGKALCSTCHPVYVTRARLYDITKANGAATSAYTPEMYGSRIKDTEYCWRWQGAGEARSCDEAVHTIPPDFLHDPMRAIRADHAVDDLFVTLGAGISGAGMPAWKGVFADDELWAVAYYVRSLIDKRGTPTGEALREALRAPDNIGWRGPSP